MKVLKKNVYKGFTFVCHSYSENKIISSTHEKNITLIKLKDGSYVELKYLIANPGRFKDIVPWLPHYYTKPNRAGEIYVDERCLKSVYANAEENEKIDVIDIQNKETTLEI